jgi:hypothetical protein
MPGMRVLDAHVYSGCHHLPPMKVHHQLTLAGIEGATFLADPERLGLRGVDPYPMEVADRWRRPRYLSRRGNFHSQRSFHPPLPSIPAIPPQSRCHRQYHRLSACDDLSPQHDFSLMTDGNEQLTQGLRKRKCLYSHREESPGVRLCVLARLLSIPTPMRNASRRVSTREKSGVSGVGSRRVVPTGRLAIRGGVCPVGMTHVSPWICWGSSTGGR